MSTATTKIEHILAEAVEIGSPRERQEFLQRACGEDAALREEVDRLLHNHFVAGSFLETPPSAIAKMGVGPTLDQPPTERPGTQIGPYKLIEQIGEGGMGTVWMAQQSEPVKRLVAAKLIKAGMDSRQVIVRFEAERQALALMDHPNIARVLDGGTTSAGRPYFVMDLVKGVPITRYCDEQHLTPRQRLELFIPVCQAIQHAHQKGIIHRDLKPSNVLVALYDSRPVPKVIDFGVAKATGQPLTEQTLVTGLGNIVGTLEYMSPEQAQINRLDIDTRSDIYSLGVLLYELLTGTTPLERKRVKQSGMLESLRIIREEEAPTLSNRLATTEELSVIAANRGLEPAKLTKLLRGELDWIVMKALEKDRNRRYGTASDFAMDLERYLADEPVQACPPSASYRLRKFVRRNKGPVLTAALVGLTLLSGICGTTVGLVRAEHALEAAMQRAEGERQARVAAQQAERAARESEADTMAFSEFLVTDVLWVPRPAGQRGGLGIHITMREALEAAEEKIDTRFRDRPRAEAVARHALGVTFRLIGEPQQAESHLRRAASLRKETLGYDHEDTLQSQNSLGVLLNELGKYVEATLLLEQTLKVRQAKLGADHRHTLSSMANLAWSYQAVGQRERALPLFQEAFKVRTEKLGPADSDTLHSMDHLALAYRDAKQPDLALPLGEKCLQLRRATQGPDHTDTLASMYVVASCYSFAGKFDAALPLADEALKHQTVKLSANHPDTLSTMMVVAACYRAKRKLDVAVPLYEKVFEGRKAKLGADNHATLTAMSLLAQAYQEAGKVELALPLAEEAFKLFTATLGPDHDATMSSMMILVSCYRAMKNPEALPLSEKAYQLQMKKLGPDDPATYQAMMDLVKAYSDAGKIELALPPLQQAVAALEKRQFKARAGVDAALILWSLFRVHERLGQFDQAEVWQRKLTAFLKQRDGPESGGYNIELANLGNNLLAQKKFAEAESVLRECLSFRHKIWPDSWLIFNAQSMLGAALLGQKKYAEAEPVLLQGYEGMKEREAQIPAQNKVRLRDALERLVQLYDAWDKRDKADEWRKKLETQTKEQKQESDPGNN